eukprot:13066287-Alexandrium_andersonii.AAC.1
MHPASHTHRAAVAGCAHSLVSMVALCRWGSFLRTTLGWQVASRRVVAPTNILAVKKMPVA